MSASRECTQVKLKSGAGDGLGGVMVWMASTSALHAASHKTMAHKPVLLKSHIGDMRAGYMGITARKVGAGMKNCHPIQAGALVAEEQCC